MSNHSFDLEVTLPRLTSGLTGRVWSRRSASVSNGLEYSRALLTELGRRADDRRWTYRSVRSVTLKLERGGLPSVEISRLIGAIQRTFAFSPGCRITCEYLPIDGNDCRAIAESGVERLFLPVMSFAPRVLKGCGSKISAEHAHRLVAAAMLAGFEAVAVKLLFGCPGQTIAEFRTDLSRLIVHAPHEVVFAPSGAPPTIGRRSLAVSQLAKMKGIIEAVMTGLGYAEHRVHHYVRSGGGVEGEMVLDAADRLGIGAGSITFTTDGQGRRILARNIPLVGDYIAAISRDGKASQSEETLSAEEEIGSAIAEMLYRRSGLDLRAIQQRFGIDLEHAYPGVLEVLTDAAFIRRQGDEVALTPTGYVAIDDVVAQFRTGFSPAYA